MPPVADPSTPARDSRRAVVAMVVALVLLVGVGITSAALLGGDCVALPPVDRDAPRLVTEPTDVLAEVGLERTAGLQNTLVSAGERLALGPLRAGLRAADGTFLVPGNERLVVAGPSLVSLSPDLGATEAIRKGEGDGRTLIPASDGVAITSPTDARTFATLNESLQESACGRLPEGAAPLAVAPRGHLLAARDDTLIGSRFEGDVAWTTGALPAAPTAAAATDELALALTADGGLAAFGLDTGAPRWQADGPASALLAANRLGVLTATETSLSLLDLDDGTTSWELTLDGPVHDADLRYDRVLAAAGTSLVRIEDGRVAETVDFADTPLRPVQAASTIAGFTAIQFRIQGTPDTDLVVLYGPPDAG